MVKRFDMIIQKEVKDCFTYNKNEGNLYSNYFRSSRVSIDQPVGFVSTNKQGKQYRVIQYKGKPAKVATLIWVYHFGEIPNNYIVQYKDEDTLNTKIDNLYIIDKTILRLSKRTTKGSTGVVYHKQSGLWRVCIKNKHMGYRKTYEEAVKFRQQLEIEHDMITNYTAKNI